MNINFNGEDITLYYKSIYNFDSLSSLLEDNGFSNVVRYDWKNTIHKDYDDDFKLIILIWIKSMVFAQSKCGGYKK